jgi:hypothetical protein
MQGTTQQHERDAKAIQKLEKVHCLLSANRLAGHAQAFAFVCVGDPFVGEEECSEERVVGEVEHQENNLGRVGDYGIKNEVVR